MNNPSDFLRSLVIYSLVVPLALLMGYQLASTDPGRDPLTWLVVGGMLLLLSLPLLIRWHQPLLLFWWNSAAFICFLPGQPQIWLLMAFLSLGLAIVQRASSRETRFVSAPSVVLPLIFLAVVIVITMRLNGDFGLRVLGSGSFGGKRYIMLFGAIAGFFAMLASEVPRHKALLFTGLFLFGSAIDILSLLVLLGPPFDYVAYVFPLEGSMLEGSQFGNYTVRSVGLTSASAAIFLFVLARYGLKDTFQQGRYGRLAIMGSALVLGSLAGFRSFLVPLLLTFGLVFCFQGLLRSRYTVILLAALMLAGALLVPLANKLPLSMQRTISFLPVNVDPVARYNAQASTEWRLDMWKTVLPEVSQYFWLGKGLGMKGAQIELAADQAWRGLRTSQEVAMIAGDYHSGPLSLMIPFGIWGILGFLWFLAASLRALYLNYHYGDESLKTINTLLLAYFIARMLHFIFVFGGFYGDLARFTGLIGLSLALNGGICRAARSQTVTTPTPFRLRDRLQEAPALPQPARSH